MQVTVLIVDDSAVMRASVSYTLQAAGYLVRESPHGQHALALLMDLVAKGQRPALILADVNMPVMDGITFIRQLKQTPERFIPILVLTTESEESKKQQGKAAGAAGWLVKPFKEDQLLAVVRRFTSP